MPTTPAAEQSKYQPVISQNAAGSSVRENDLPRVLRAYGVARPERKAVIAIQPKNSKRQRTIVWTSMSVLQILCGGDHFPSRNAIGRVRPDIVPQ